MFHRATLCTLYFIHSKKLSPHTLLAFKCFPYRQSAILRSNGEGGGESEVWKAFTHHWAVCQARQNLSESAHYELLPTQIFMLPFTKSALWEQVPINVKGVNISCLIYFAVNFLWGDTAEAKGGDLGDMITYLSLQKSAKPVGSNGSRYLGVSDHGCHLYSVCHE